MKQKPLLKTKGLTKDFGNGKGIFDVGFEIRPGEIVGFVGPNGAGKTTTMSILSGFVSADQGSYQMLGKKNLGINSTFTLMSDLGILLADVSFPRNLTARQIFTNQASLLQSGTLKNWQELAKDLDLDLDIQFGKLSTGNKKKVGVISAVMHKPKLVMMDEPTSGLDPLIQQKFLNMLEEIANSGGAVLLSSHVLSEVQSVCSRVIMIKDGKVLFDDPTEEILDKSMKRFRFTELDNKVLKEIKALKGDVTVDVHKEEVIVLTSDRSKVLEILNKHKIYDFYLEKPSLEEMFIEYYV